MIKIDYSRPRFVIIYQGKS